MIDLVNKIQVIKAVREKSGLSLKEALDIVNVVEQVGDSWNPCKPVVHEDDSLVQVNKYDLELLIDAAIGIESQGLNPVTNRQAFLKAAKRAAKNL
jgi:Ribosomal protein L7/L12 C-terminal domain